MRTPVVRWFWDNEIPKTQNDIVTNPDPSTYAPAILNYFNLRYIILYKWILGAREYASSKALVDTIMPGAKPVADDSAITAYAVPVTATTEIMPILLLEDWPDVEYGNEGPQRWVRTRPVTFVVVNATQHSRVAQLELKVLAYVNPRTLNVSLNGTQAAAIPIKPEVQKVLASLSLSPGRNEVVLSSPEPGISPSKLDQQSVDTRLLTFAVFNLSVK